MNALRHRLLIEDNLGMSAVADPVPISDLVGNLLHNAGRYSARNAVAPIHFGMIEGLATGSGRRASRALAPAAVVLSAACR